MFRLKIFFPQFFWFPKFFPQQKSLEQRIFRVKIRYTVAVRRFEAEKKPSSMVLKLILLKKNFWDQTNCGKNI